MEKKYLQVPAYFLPSKTVNLYSFTSFYGAVVVVQLKMHAVPSPHSA